MDEKLLFACLDQSQDLAEALQWQFMFVFFLGVLLTCLVAYAEREHELIDHCPDCGADL